MSNWSEIQTELIYHGRMLELVELYGTGDAVMDREAHFREFSDPSHAAHRDGSVERWLARGADFWFEQPVLSGALPMCPVMASWTWRCEGPNMQVYPKSGIPGAPSPFPKLSLRWGRA